LLQNQTRKISFIDTYETYSKGKRIDTNGVIWMDYVDSPESRLKQKRIRTAFQNSGILE
jgi:hypothetical protein